MLKIIFTNILAGIISWVIVVVILVLFHQPFNRAVWITSIPVVVFVSYWIYTEIKKWRMKQPKSRI